MGEDGLGIAVARRRCLELLVGGVLSWYAREEIEGERESCGDGHEAFVLADLCPHKRVLLLAGDEDLGRR